MSGTAAYAGGTAADDLDRVAPGRRHACVEAAERERSSGTHLSIRVAHHERAEGRGPTVGMAVPGAASAQPLAQSTGIGRLVNVNVGGVAVNIRDITLEDLVNVNDVLNDNIVEVLNNVLNRSPILSNTSEVLTHLLREADFLTDTQVVVGVLSGGLFVVQDLDP